MARQRPCLPLWGRCPSVRAGADEVGTHRRFIPTPNKQNCRCPALLFPSILLKVHTSLGAFQPHPTRLAPGHLPQRGRLWYAKRSFIVICQHRKGSQEALRFGEIAAFFVGFLSISQFEKTYKLFLQTKFRFSLSGQKLFSLPDNVKFFPFFSALFPLSDSCISVVHNAIITA